jgi:hypothetical protein
LIGSKDDTCATKKEKESEELDHLQKRVRRNGGNYFISIRKKAPLHPIGQLGTSKEVVPHSTNGQ